MNDRFHTGNVGRRDGVDSRVNDDRQLIDGCRAGDRRSWRRLLDRYERLVYAVPYNLGMSGEDADDVVQSTFAIFLERIDTLTTNDRLGAWLSTVARRQTFRLWERRQRDQAVAERAVESVDDGAWAIRIEEVEWVDRALAGLNERCRALLTLLYFTDPPPAYDEVARDLGRPVGSIGPTRARCLATLERLLADLTEEPDATDS
jgi:RNA polymerase sigma factor (sigma-70 family)